LLPGRAEWRYQIPAAGLGVSCDGVNSHLFWLLLYTVGLTAFGVWMGRRVKGASDFFVAGRKLNALLVGSTVLAANIGAGTTVGAAGLAYKDGISAWWWNGAAGIGTLILALWVGPKLWAIAVKKDHLTVGDFLEDRYSASVRGVVAGLLLIGTLALLAAQLIAGAAVLEVVAGMPRWQGVAVGGIAMTIYFTAGGLLSSAWVNLLQLIVLLGGFIIALPMVLSRIGGIAAIAAAPSAPPSYWDVMYSSGASSGWTLLILLTPSFIISPGLVGKAYGAESARAIRIGIGVAGVAQLFFSLLPVLLGMSARVHYPDIASTNLVLPTVLLNELPTLVGALALSAVFSAEVSTCDAILYMLSTSSSKDLYKRFVNPSADSAQVLSVARAAAVIGGIFGMILAIQFATIVDALRIFYSLMAATLFVPVLGALLSPRATARDAMSAIVLGVGTLLAVYFGTNNKGWWDPSLWGLIGSAVGFTISRLVPRSTTAS
jgi:SSS family solute:Na+ symporter